VRLKDTISKKRQVDRKDCEGSKAGRCGAQPRKAGKKPQRYAPTTKAELEKIRSHACNLAHPKLDSVSDRVQYILGLMSEGIWNEKTTRHLTASIGKTWGVAVSTVQNYSSEAHRSIDDVLRSRRAEIALRRIHRLEKISDNEALMYTPGNAGAVVRANEVLLRAVGYAEPEEDKERANTLQIVPAGGRVTSPVFKALLGIHEEEDDGQHQECGQAEGATKLPEEAVPGTVVQKDGER